MDKESILQEFDNGFMDGQGFDRIDVRRFISQAIDDTEKRWKEKRIEIGIKHAREMSECEKRVRDEIKSKIEDEYVIVPLEGEELGDHIKAIAYNEALDNIKSKL